MLHDILTELRPLLAEAILAGIAVIMAWVGAKLRTKLGVDIEARYRESLHSALKSGVDRILDRIVADPAINAADTRVAEVVAYVERSVPDALRALAPSKEQLRAMAVAKARDALAKLSGDPMTAALRDAGADASEPR